MARTATSPDPDDYFAETRMSFGDHIEDLRTHLIRAILGFIVGMCIAFAFGSWVQDFITAPVVDQLQKFYDHRVDVVAKKLEEGSDAEYDRVNQPTRIMSVPPATICMALTSRASSAMRVVAT